MPSSFGKRRQNRQNKAGFKPPLSWIAKNSLALRNPESSIAFRFGVNQSEKIRARGDLKHSRANEACSATAPTKLATWDHIAELRKRAENKKRSWGLFEAGRASAYKQLPVNPDHANYVPTALK